MRGKDKARQGLEDHGDSRLPWASSRAIHIDSATPHEVTLVKATLAQMLVKGPKRLIGDNAYESDQRNLHSPPVLNSTAIGALVPTAGYS
jgi:hypothetical protein